MKNNFGLNVWVVAVSLVLANLVKPSSALAAYFLGLGDLPIGTIFSSALGVSTDKLNYLKGGS
jgi:hypothetical protein